MVTRRGSDATLPCRLQGSPHDFFATGEMRIRWSKLSLDHLDEVDVLVSMGIYKKSFGSFHNRVYLKEADENDASLVITNVTLHDTGVYKCEIIDGMDDGAGIITLELQGKQRILPRLLLGKENAVAYLRQIQKTISVNCCCTIVSYTKNTKTHKSWNHYTTN